MSDATEAIYWLGNAKTWLEESGHQVVAKGVGLAVAFIERKAAEIARKDAEIERLKADIEWLRLTIPLTDEEAQKAYDEAPSVPVSKERIAEMVRYATGLDAGPIAAPLEPATGEADEPIVYVDWLRKQRDAIREQADVEPATGEGEAGA